MTDRAHSLRRIEEIFEGALALPAEQRAAFVDAQCGGDEFTRNEVHSLLAHDSAETIAALRTPFISAPTGMRAESRGATRPGERVGDVIDRFELVEAIGEGGFGTVYLAHQRQPIERDVALKVIKAGMDTRQVIARFEAERQTLAMMDHPNMARVLDGGATDASLGGRPYFVMEFVTGRPITVVCDEERLSVEERLELFTQVCGAVQHAHQKGVVHRDLKPSNILVQNLDGRRIAKVIDFGIAKAIGPTADQRSMMTEAGQFMGTPEYMSPEQASSGSVDTRTDIYSLGVVLYELMVGTLPLDFTEARRSGFIAMQRAIGEVTPVKPSSHAGTATQHGLMAAANRGADPAALRRQLKGDLDWISMRAIEKDPDRRYSSVSELAADINRHLQHQPVLAGPPGVSYRMRKFMRRNRVWVAAASVALLAIVGGGVGAGVGFARAVAAEKVASERATAEAHARGLAERRFSQVRELAQKLTHDIHDAVADVPGSTAARQLIVKTGMEYADSLAEEAKDDRALAIDLGASYRRLADVLGKPSMANLGDTLGAIEAYRKAVALLEPYSIAHVDDPRLVVELRESLFGVAHMLRVTGRGEEAMVAFRAAADRFEKMLEHDSDNTAYENNVETAYVNIGRMQEGMGDLPGARAAYERYRDYLKKFSEEAMRRKDAARTATSNSNLASISLALAEVNRRIGDLQACIAVHREGLAYAREVLQNDPGSSRALGSVAETCRLLAYALSDSGQVLEAEPLARESAELWRSIAAADPNDARAARNAAIGSYSLGLIAQAQGDWAKSLEHHREYRDAITTVAANNPHYATVQRDVAIALQAVARALNGLEREAEAAVEMKACADHFGKLAEADPNDAMLQRDQANSLRQAAEYLLALAETETDSQRIDTLARADEILDESMGVARRLFESGRIEEEIKRSLELGEELRGKIAAARDGSEMAL